MTREEIRRQLTGKDGQGVLKWISRFSNGYRANLISVFPHGCRIQLQDKRAEEDEGIVCVTGKDLIHAIQNAIARRKP